MTWCARYYNGNQFHRVIPGQPSSRIPTGDRPQVQATTWIRPELPTDAAPCCRSKPKRPAPWTPGIYIMIPGNRKPELRKMSVLEGGGGMDTIKTSPGRLSDARRGSRRGGAPRQAAAHQKVTVPGAGRGETRRQERRIDANPRSLGGVESTPSSPSTRRRFVIIAPGGVSATIPLTVLGRIDFNSRRPSGDAGHGN